MCTVDKEPSLPVYFTLPRIAKLLKQILEALAFIHTHNIIHCDLKPENILICDVNKSIFGVVVP